MPNADEYVQQIVAETARRKAVWERMQAAAEQALQAVLQHARSQGVDTAAWLESEQNQLSLYYSSEEQRVPEEFTLLIPGSLQPAEHLRLMESTYQGYPGLPNDAPELFLRQAVELLMSGLNDYHQNNE